MARLVAAMALSSLLAACSAGSGSGIELTLAFDSSVADAALASVQTLDFAASGDEAYAQTLTLGRPALRTERTVYHPDAGTQHVTITVVARDGSGAAVAMGATPPLAPGASATIELEAISAVDGGTIGTVAVYAGTPGGAGSADGIGAAAYFDSPTGIAVDATHFYVVSEGSSTVSVVDRATLAVTRVAGSPWRTGSDLQHLAMPHSAAVIGADVFIADQANSAVRRLSGGQLHELANPGHVAGPCASNELYYPRGLATNGTVLFVANGDHTICRVDPTTGTTTALAGMPGQYGNADGVGTAAGLSDLQGIAYAEGRVYIADFENDVIRTLDPSTATVTTLIGQNGTCTEVAGPPISAATICIPPGVTVVGETLYIAQQAGLRSYVLKPAGDTIDFVVGLPGSVGSVDGSGSTARVNKPSDLVAYKTAANTDAVLVADTLSHAVRSFDVTTGALSTIAGALPHPGHDDGARSTATFSSPHGLAVANGDVYVADAGNSAVRVIEQDAVTTLVSGAPLMTPAAIAVAGDVVYVADSSANAVFTVAGGKATSFAGHLHAPSGIAASSDRVYVADTSNDDVLVFDASGTLQDTLDLGLSTTENVGCATGLGLKAPSGLALDASARVLYVAARGNCAVFAYDLAMGVTTLVAGSTRGSQDGIGAAAQLDAPTALALDGAGSLYVVDFGAATLRRIELATSTVSTFAGVVDQAGIATGTRTTAHVNRGGGVAWLAGKGLLASMPSENALVLVTP